MSRSSAKKALPPKNALTRLALQYREDPTEENFNLFYPHLKRLIVYTLKVKPVRVKWRGFVLGERKLQDIRRSFSSAMEFLRLYPHVDVEDLIQEGCILALQNLEKYDPSVSSSFSNYAMWGAMRGVERCILYQLRGHEDVISFRSGFRDGSQVRYVFPQWSDETENDIWRTFHNSRPYQPGWDGSLCNRLQEKEDELWLQDLYAHLVVRFWKRSRYVDRERAYASAVRHCDAFFKVHDLLRQGEHTLQEVGDSWGLTRERVRQLVMKVVRYLGSHPKLWGH